MRALRTSVVVALVVALGSSLTLAAAAQCGWTARSLTTLSTTFPRTGGGLVVALDPASGGALAEATLPAITVTRGRRTSVTLTPVAIAPGLFRVPFDAQVRRGLWTLHGLGPDATLTLGAGAPPAVPVRPAVRQMRRVAASGLGSSGQRIEVRADLEFPVPEGVVASLVTWNTDATPAAWMRATVGQTEMVVYTDPGGACPTAAPGWTSPSDPPLVARLSWVDRFGQISPASDAITVQ
ncbi:MAG: hypothetical protein U0234_18170 [Sandaracinus sp.]